MAITGCSLTCLSSSSSGNQFSCNITTVKVNEEIRVTFNQPVDLSSANNTSFQVVERPAGKTPPSKFLLDTGSSNTLVYRPLLTFDSSGNPIFGLTQGATYDLKVLGTGLDPTGPYIRSQSGDSNRTQLSCTLVANGIADPKAGAPRATVFVDTVDPNSYDPNNYPTIIFPDQVATGRQLENVFRDTDVTIVFDDLINPATLANPVTGESSFVTIRIDSDGDPSTTADQIDVAGSFTLMLDQDALVTTLVFEPDAGFPSAGALAPVKRKVVVNLSSSIKDLGGNPLLNPGNVIFIPEVIPFMTQTVTESFDNQNNEDSLHGGSVWGAGILMTGPGGGSGRLGDLVVPRGMTVTLNSDLEDFSAPEFFDPVVFNRQLVVDPVSPLQVVGGVFEFSRLLVESGSTLRLVGSNPCRLLIRGEATFQGVLAANGESATVHTATEFVGGDGAEPGPGGGDGGSGGARPDGENFLNQGGVDNPNNPGPVNPLNPADYALLNGESGIGIPFPDALNPTTRVVFGEGGLAWPQPGALPAPFNTIHFPADPSDANNFPYEPTAACQIIVPGGTGAGGGYALDGIDGSTEFIDVQPPVPPPLPPEALGGDSDDLALSTQVRSLNPELGYLRGGSGGGGGGAHLTVTSVNGQIGFDCTVPVGSPTLMIVDYQAHSSAGGGGGGGGIQLQAGRRAVLNGRVDCSGGDGGSSVFPDLAQSGGAGSGGAFLIQGPLVQIQAIPGRIGVEGGLGGVGPFGSQAGAGGPGLVRIETFPPLLSINSEKAKISPSESELINQYGSGVTIDDILSVDEWRPLDTTSGPTTASGAQSCWFQIPGNFFQLVFEDDGTELGWDMLLKIQGIATPQSYRGENDITGPGGMSLEELWGNDLGSAPVVVRFQGARSNGPISQPCNVPLAGVTSPIATGSLTGWVKHSRELTTVPSPSGITSNIFRFSLIWDRSQPEFSMIEHLEEIWIRVTPD